MQTDKELGRFRAKLATGNLNSANPKVHLLNDTDHVPTVSFRYM